MRALHLLLATAILLAAPNSVSAQSILDGCAYTPTQWLEHPDAWPTEQLEVGLVLRDKTELLSLLDSRGNGPDLGSLTRETIAAKLNVENGAPAEIGPYIIWADLILAQGKNNSRRFRELRGGATINEVRRVLSNYNAQGCDATVAATQALFESILETVSFGGVKAHYHQ